MKPWLVALDVDGTILTNGYQVLPEVRAAIQTARRDGVTVALATARSLDAMRHVLDETGGVDAAICFGGAVTLWPMETVPVAEATLAPGQIAEVARFARGLDVSLALYGLHEVYVDRMDARLETEFRMTGLTAVETDLTLLDRPVIKGLAISDRHDASSLHTLQARFGAEMSVLFSHVNFMEIMRSGVSKGGAVSALAGRLGVAMDRVIVMGDSENDLSMFAAAGVPIAMGNASDRVKAQARWVTLTNDEGGVAAALDRCRDELWR